MINEFEENDDSFEDEEDTDGDHTDDDGEPCNCMDQECGEDGGCPECGADPEDIDLVCGDHGCRCSKCNATFCCP